MSNTLAITSDRGAVLSPGKLAIQADALTPLTVTFDAATIALFGSNPVFRLDFRLADGTEVYVGSYSVAASVAVTLPASVFAQEGGLTVQARVTDDAGLVWHSLEAEAFISDAIEAGTPASADTRVYVETPPTFTAGNLAGYNPTSGKLEDSGSKAADFDVAGAASAVETAEQAIRTDTHEPTGFLDRVATLSWSDVTRTLTITGSHSFYYRGTKFTKSGGTKQISTDVGMHYLYYDATGTLVESFNTFPNTDVALVAFVYWNGTKGLVADERHGIAMDWATHLYLHQTVGTRYGSGLGGTFADATFSVALGTIFDEDLAHDLGAATHADVLYMDGSTTWQWLEDQTKYYHDNGTLLYYNSGTSLATVAANRYVAYWVFATNSLTRPIVALMGQRIDTTLAQAQANNKYESLSLGTLPFKEMKLLYRVILKGDKVWQETQDLRSISNLPAGSYVATEHDALTGIKGAGTYHLNPAVSGLVAGDGAGNFAAATAAQIGAQAINDVGGYFTTDTVDGALQQVGAADADIYKYLSTPIATYTHSGNREVTVTAVDVSTDTFTAVGHGFINTDRVTIVVNDANAALDYNYKYLPTGIGYSQYYIVNKTNDTFQLSLTSGGAAIDLTAKGTMDLTKWHLELPPATDIVINNLPGAYKYKVRIKGKSCRGIYIKPNSANVANVFAMNASTVITNYPGVDGTFGAKWLAEVVVDFASWLTFSLWIQGIQPASDTTNTVTFVDKFFISTVDKTQLITSISIIGAYPINGLIIEVFKV